MKHKRKAHDEKQTLRHSPANTTLTYPYSMSVTCAVSISTFRIGCTYHLCHSLGPPTLAPGGGHHRFVHCIGKHVRSLVGHRNEKEPQGWPHCSRRPQTVHRALVSRMHTRKPPKILYHINLLHNANTETVIFPPLPVFTARTDRTLLRHCGPPFMAIAGPHKKGSGAKVYELENKNGQKLSLYL